MIAVIEGKEYELDHDLHDSFITPGLIVAYCSQLALNFMPVLLDPHEHGSKPFPPEFVAYRLIIDTKGQRLCILYEVYWRRQECTWKDLNKDHDHDYEQIQLHFNMKTGNKERVVVSSVGPVSCAGHGVEVYSHISKAQVREVEYNTSPRGPFPWGGDNGRKWSTQVREIPIGQLIFENKRPTVLVVNCYHAFVGSKRNLSIEERNELYPRLERLDRSLLRRWYYRNIKNRFGHDISKPFVDPYVMYIPPPEDIKSRLVYGFLWLLFLIKKNLGRP